MEGAVRSGDQKQVEALIQSGAEVNERLEDGSLLILAIEAGYTDIALALLAAGADVHAKDKGGWTALHWACLKGLEKVVRALIDRGSRVNEVDGLGRTPLMLAEQWADEAMSMCLLRAEASCEGLPRRRVDDLFRHAYHERDLSAVWTLLKNGCRVSILSREEQEKLLYHACCEDDVFVVEALLASGCNVNCVYSTGYTPLMYATENGHEEVVKKLILAVWCWTFLSANE